MIDVGAKQREIRALLEEWAEFRFADVERSNRAFDGCGHIGRELREAGILPEVFRSLMHDGNPAIAGYAATTMLFHDPEAAESVLDRISKLPGLAGFGAEMSLRLWREGTLKPPF